MFALSWEDSTSSSIISLRLSSDLLEELVVSLLSGVDLFCKLEESVSVGEKFWGVVSWLRVRLLMVIGFRLYVLLVRVLFSVHFFMLLKVIFLLLLWFFFFFLLVTLPMAIFSRIMFHSKDLH